MDRTLVFKVWKDSTGDLVATNDDLHMMSFGSNPAELLADIGRDFAWLWEKYVEADPSELTNGAVELGKRLKELPEKGVTIRLEWEE